MRSAWQHLQRKFIAFALAPLRVVAGTFGVGLLVAVGLILLGTQLYAPTTFSLDDRPVGGPMVQPADFTPVASAPAEFNAAASPPPTRTSQEESGQAESTPAPAATSTAVIDDLERQASQSRLGRGEGRYLAILLLGADLRPIDEVELARSDTLMVAVLDMLDPRATIISVPRDLWVPIPGYDNARINTAFFLGEAYGEGGAELARQTVSQVLDIPISHTVTIDFNGFRTLIDEIGGIEIDVPTTIDDYTYPDDQNGTMHLHIDEGLQTMDGDLALMYARTRHADNDFHRAARQQAVISAVRTKLLRPAQVPQWPSYIRLAASEIDTSLTLSDLFYLARFARALEDDDISMHVIEPPLLWEGFTADGQQVLLYNPSPLQDEVRSWLDPQMVNSEARQP